MFRHRRQGSLDQNHLGVVLALRAAGCVVVDTASLGQGIPDLWAQSPQGRAIWIEVKRPGPKSARKLTESEAAWHAQAVRRGVVAVVVQSAQEAVDVLFAKPARGPCGP
jgi:hypothetical protein